jgi:hypothetical protein
MPRQLFPYIGGKYTVAPEINRRFGAIDTRIDAFTPDRRVGYSHQSRFGTRSSTISTATLSTTCAPIKYAPEEVARHLDFPRAELELIAYRHYTRDTTAGTRIASRRRPRRLLRSGARGTLGVCDGV